MHSAAILSNTNVGINDSEFKADAIMGSGANSVLTTKLAENSSMITLLSDDEEDTIVEILDVPDSFLASAENLSSKVSVHRLSEFSLKHELSKIYPKQHETQLLEVNEYNLTGIYFTE